MFSPDTTIADSDTTVTINNDRLRYVLSASILILAAVAYSFHLTSFLHAKEAIVLLGLVCFAWLQYRSSLLTPQGLTLYLPLWILLTITLFARLLIFPCHVPATFMVEWTRLASLLLLAAWFVPTCFSENYARKMHGAILLSVAIVAVLGLGQYLNCLPSLFPVFPGYSQRMYSVFGNQDLLGGYLALGIPLLLHYAVHESSKKYTLPFGFLLFLLCLVLFLSGSRSAWLAAFIGSFVALRSFHSQTIPRYGWALLIAILLLFLCLPGTVARITQTFQATDVGGNARLWFWDGALRMFRDSPIIGVGLGNFAYWSPYFLGEALQAPGGIHHYHNELDTSNAHCDPLQLLDETGIVGILCFIWMLMRLYRTRGPEWGAMTALGVFCLFNNPFHCAPHALIGLFCTGLLIARKSITDSSPPPSSLLHASIPAALALVVFYAWAVVIPSYQLRKAEDAHLAHDPATLAYYDRCIHSTWFNPTAHDEYGLALLDDNRLEEARVQFELALRGLDTGRIYLALGRIALHQQGYQQARNMFEQCLWRWPSNEEAQKAWRLLMHSPPVQKAAQ